jgi:transcriptional regulator GlxA family with amidase domain
MGKGIGNASPTTPTLQDEAEVRAVTFRFAVSLDMQDWTRGYSRGQERTGGKIMSETKSPLTLGAIFYNNFELLDVYGPLEMFGNVGPELRVVTVAQKAGAVASAQGPKALAEYGFADCPPLDLILLPGGIGTLAEVENPAMLEFLRQRSSAARVTMSVCSGSGILAKAGLLDGRRATSNKQFFSLITTQNDKVQWVEKARWVEDGKFVTSSGVSAGMDMSLAVIAKLYGQERAEFLAAAAEYEWHRDANHDPFIKYLNKGDVAQIVPGAAAQ